MRPLYILILILSSTSAFGQKDSIPVIMEAPVIQPEYIFTLVIQYPYFPGGDTELERFIQKHIRYPAWEWYNDMEGRVVVSFWVERDGSIGDVTVKRSAGYGFDAEAVRVVRSLPRFHPGRMNGLSGRVSFTLPIVFRLAATR